MTDQTITKRKIYKTQDGIKSVKIIITILITLVIMNPKLEIAVK
jgi:hypothetical protein